MNRKKNYLKYYYLFATNLTVFFFFKKWCIIIHENVIKTVLNNFFLQIQDLGFGTWGVFFHVNTVLMERGVMDRPYHFCKIYT